MQRAAAESGYQVIQGTRVFTVIDHDADTATFSNDCGSQTISHRDLGNGAIPDRIIPCPRPVAAPPPIAAPPTSADRDSEPRGAATAPDLPGGSYAQTCRQCRTGPDGITCQCRRIDQSYRATAIDPRRCVGGEVENLDGRLSCTQGARSARVPPHVGQPASPPYAWISVAAGIERFGSRTSVAIGYSRGRSQSEARDAATDACMRSDSGVSTCKAVGAWSRGCIYITTTTSDDDGGATAWGSGPTAQAAYDNCMHQPGVIQCVAKTIGGCVE